MRRFESLVVPLYLWRSPRPESLAALKAVLGVQRSHVLVERNFVRILASNSIILMIVFEAEMSSLLKEFSKRLGEFAT